MDVGHEILVTFSGAVVFGVLFTLVARKLNISSIVILLIGGIALGPQGLGWINPNYLGHGLKAIISIAVGLILFEGGLTLDPKGYKLVSKEIKGVLTRGVLVTWLASSITIKFFFHFPWDFSLLAGSLIIVTGPTVIGPLLKRIRVRNNLQNLLHWESVLIDPIGVFIALLCYEWIINPGDQPIIEFFKRAIVGITFGISWGYFNHHVIKRRIIPVENINITFLASAIAIFTLSNLVAHESGLLSVTIAGFVMGYLQKQKLDRVKIYKAELIQLLIGLLFVLLAANLNLKSFVAFGVKGLGVVLIIMLIVRPLNIFISTMGSPLSFNEKLFLGWVAPRGIVAASMASLFTLNLKEIGLVEAGFLETFTYAVIIGTVLFQGLTANWVARILGVLEPKPKGWLVVGAHRLGRTVASFLKENNVKVVLLDTNLRNVAQSRREGFLAFSENALTVNVEDRPEIYGIGKVLAITDNEDLNTLICQRWRTEIAGVKVFKWGQRPESENKSLGDPFRNGQQVWNNLHLDQIMAMDLEAKESGILKTKSKIENVMHADRVLMCAWNSEVLPYLPKNEKGSCLLLTFLLSPIHPNLKIKKDWIIQSNSKLLTEVTMDLLEKVKLDYPNLDIQRLYKKLVDYENKYSGLICPETALPHSYTEEIDESIVLFAKLVQPIESIHSDERISMVFLVLSPENEPQKHLNTLAEISKFIINEENRTNLLNAQSHQELLEILLPPSLS